MTRITESSPTRFFDYVPFVSMVSGMGRLINDFFSKLTDKNTKDEPSQSLKDRIHVWGETKRGAVAIFPFVGNVILFYHDRKVSQELFKALKIGTKEDLPELLAQVPKGDQTKAFFLKVAKENPEILAYVPADLKRDPSFLAKAIKEDINAARFLPGLPKETILAILNLNQEWFSRNTAKDKAILNAVPEMTDNRDFLLEAAKLGCDVTPYLSKHSDDKNFILEMMRLFRNKTIRIGSPQAENIQPDLSYTLNAFKAASEDLKKDRDFIEKALAIYDGVLKEIPAISDWINDEDLMFNHFVDWKTLKGFDQVGNQLKSDQHSMTKAFQKNIAILNFINPSLFRDATFMQVILALGHSELRSNNFPEQIVRDPIFRDLLRSHGSEALKNEFFSRYPDLT